MKRLLFGVLLATIALTCQGGVYDLGLCLTGQVKSRSCDATIKNYWAHQPLIVRAAKEEGIEPELLFSVVAIESRFNHQAISPKGARGLTQVMPATGQSLGVYNEAWLLDPYTSLRAGSRYLALMWRQFGDWRLAIAAYNAGPGAVQRYRGIPPYQETQLYVQDVLWMYALIKSHSRPRA